MNMIAAARETLEAARKAGMDQISSDFPEADFPHLGGMVETMETTEMSEGKKGRWLGWIQACVYLADVGLKLEDMKEINRRHA